MKIGGVEVSGPAEEVLVLPRLGGNVVIRAKAVLDTADFDNQISPPKAPGKLTKEGFQPNTQDPDYLVQLTRYNSIRYAFVVLKSLEPSNIEWETVKMEDPGTWENWQEELVKSGFSSIEIQRIIACVSQANCLDEAKLKEARDAFLHGQGQA